MTITPPATRLAGGAQVLMASGRNPGKCFPDYGPMPFLLLLLCALQFAPLAHAQSAPGAKPPADSQAPAAQAVSAAPAPAAADKPAEQGRDTGGYRFPALARTVADMQNLAHAMQLRDYCADRRVADAFVRERLRRFGALTGREETCSSLLDY